MGSPNLPVYSPSPQTALARVKRLAGWLVVFAMVTLMLIAVVSGPPRQTPLAAAETSTTIAASPTTTSSAPTTTTLAPTTTTTTSLAPSPNEPALDPVAQVARVVGPAVVLIETPDGLGSGVVYSAEGYVLTAAHVLGDPSAAVTVSFADGRVMRADILGIHEPTDLAVLSVGAVADLPIATFAAPGSTQIGQLAVALGSPFGFDRTVTAGIVSAVDRVVNEVPMIQTDAAINPGNSGGPLVNSAGEVIGINDIIFTETRSNSGVGFAISIDLAAQVAEQIVAGERVVLPYLGVTMSDSNDATPGVLVERVSRNSPADLAGLQAGDLIFSMDGAPVVRGDTVRARILRTLIGDEVTIGFRRDGAELTTVVEVGSR